MKVKIINLAKRTDRWQQVVKDVTAFGITDFERFDAFDGGYLGFNKSVHTALENERELLLLEDDVYFTGTLNDLLQAKEMLPDDWDLLYLGANVLSPQRRFNGVLWNLKDAWTSHAILYSDKGARWCYEHFDPQEGTIYDEWLRTVAQKQLRCFIINPMIAFQRDGFSDIWGTENTYGLKDTERFLQ
jgi:GR25 family glycosyltransferase involved in LPS biosynthesis